MAHWEENDREANGLEPDEREFVAVSRFVVANDKHEEVRAAFRARPRAVERARGFRGFEVLQPTDDEREFWLITRWTDEQSFHDWHHSHAFKDSHAGIPRGLKLDPKRTRLRFFQGLPS